MPQSEKMPMGKDTVTAMVKSAFHFHVPIKSYIHHMCFTDT